MERILGSANYAQMWQRLGETDLKGVTVSAKWLWPIDKPSYPSTADFFLGVRGGLIEGAPDRKATTTLNVFGGLQRRGKIIPFILSGEVGYTFAPKDSNLGGIQALIGTGLGSHFGDFHLKFGYIWDPNRVTNESLRTYMIIGFDFPLSIFD